MTMTDILFRTRLDINIARESNRLMVNLPVGDVMQILGHMDELTVRLEMYQRKYGALEQWRALNGEND